MNSTNYYELSQIEPTDKPTWLVMYNSDMLKIDTGIHEAKTTADGAVTAAAAAQSTADTATTNLATLSGTVGNLAGDLSTAIGNINTINSLIGNGTPTTTDQTIIGAINEINAHTANLDAAVAGLILEREEQVVYNVDMSLSNQANLTAFKSTIESFLQSLATNERWETDFISINGVAAAGINRVPSSSDTFSSVFFRTEVSSAALTSHTFVIEAAPHYVKGEVTASGYNYSNMDSATPTSATWYITFKIWRVNS